MLLSPPGGAMRLVQFVLETGERRVGRLDGDAIVDVTNPAQGFRSVLDLVEWADRQQVDLPAAIGQLGSTGGATYSFAALDVAPQPGRRYLDLPLHAPEVWGCGVTYRKSAEFRDEETGQPKGLYDYVYS